MMPRCGVRLHRPPRERRKRRSRAGDAVEAGRRHDEPAAAPAAALHGGDVAREVGLSRHPRRLRLPRGGNRSGRAGGPDPGGSRGSSGAAARTRRRPLATAAGAARHEPAARTAARAGRFAAVGSLRRCLATTEGLARRLVALEVNTGAEVITQGDVGERFYIIADGAVEILEDGVLRRRQGAARPLVRSPSCTPSGGPRRYVL